MDKINQKLLALTAVILVTIAVIYARSFTNDVPSCEGYITNVYLYLVLGLLVTAFSVLFIAKRKFPITTTKSLMALVVAIGALFAMYSVNPSQVLLNHLAWLAFLVAISVSVYGVWRYSEYRGAISITLLGILLLVAGLTAIVWVRPEWISLGWGQALTVGLLAIILAWVIPIIFGITVGKWYYKLVSAAAMSIFIFWVLYDTKLLKVKADTCTIPDYPTDSVGLFLDILNMVGISTFV